MEWYNILALSLSALALMGSCFTYFVHDKKLKKQQTLLNDLQIKKLQREIKDDEVGSNAFNVMKTFEVVVTPVEDVERVLFIWNDIHCFCVVDSCWRYVKECWNLCFQIIQCMHLDTTFLLPEQSPFKCAQT